MQELIEIGTKVLLRQHTKVLRDFREIQAQRSMKDREKTFASLESMCRRSMSEDLWRLTRYPLAEQKDKGLYWFAKIVEGKENFILGIPMFATVLAFMCDDEVRFALINLHHSNNIISVEPEGGFRSQTTGLCRVNNTPFANNAHIATDLPLNLPNKRDLHGNLLSCTYTCIGNVDGFVLKMDEIEAKIAELMLTEAGGSFSQTGDICVGSNTIIHEELRGLVPNSHGSEKISFCCGPTNKFPTWSPSIYKDALIAESHCSARGIERVQQVQELIRELMKIPKDYKILLMNGSATGAIECAFFNLLGHNSIQSVAFDVFGRRWSGEIEAMIENLKKYSKNYPFLSKMHYNVDTVIKGEIPNETEFDPKSDLVLVYTGTSTGHVWDKHLLRQTREDRVIIADATSAAFVEDLPWACLDATAFSFQKVLGCEAGIGCLVLSPKAVNLILSRGHVFFAPRILRLNETWIRKIADEGKLVNTISMLNLHEAYCGLKWAINSGGLEFMRRAATRNQQIIQSNMGPELEHLMPESMRAKSLLCIRPSDESLQTWEFVNKVASLSEKLGVISIAGHPEEVPCWRFWTGPTATSVEDGFARFLKAFAEARDSWVD